MNGIFIYSFKYKIYYKIAFEFLTAVNKLKDEITFWTDPKNKTEKSIHSVFLFFNS